MYFACSGHAHNALRFIKYSVICEYSHVFAEEHVQLWCLYNEHETELKEWLSEVSMKKKAGKLIVMPEAWYKVFGVCDFLIVSLQRETNSNSTKLTAQSNNKREKVFSMGFFIVTSSKHVKKARHYI